MIITGKKIFSCAYLYLALRALIAILLHGTMNIELKTKKPSLDVAPTTLVYSHSPEDASTACILTLFLAVNCDLSP